MTWKMTFLNFMTFREWKTLLKGKMCMEFILQNLYADVGTWRVELRNGSHWLLTFNKQLCFRRRPIPQWISSNTAIPSLILSSYWSYSQSCCWAVSAPFSLQIISIKLPFVSCGWWVADCFTVERCRLSFCQSEVFRMISRRLNNWSIW